MTAIISLNKDRRDEVATEFHIIRYKRSQWKKPRASCNRFSVRKRTPSLPPPLLPSKLGRETKSILRFLIGEEIKRALSEGQGGLRKKHKSKALQVHPFTLLLPTESTWT